MMVKLYLNQFTRKVFLLFLEEGEGFEQSDEQVAVECTVIALMVAGQG